MKRLILILTLVVLAGAQAIVRSQQGERPEVRCFVSEVKLSTLASTFNLHCADGDESWSWRGFPMAKAPAGMKIHDPISLEVLSGDSDNPLGIYCHTENTGSQTTSLECSNPDSNTKKPTFRIHGVPAWVLPDDALGDGSEIHILFAIDEPRRSRIEKWIKLQEWKTADQAKRKAAYATRAGGKMEDANESEDEPE